MTNYQLHPMLLSRLCMPMNDVSIRRLRKALKGLVEFKNFPDFECDLRHFEWTVENLDRNLWWQLQQLPMLAWACGQWPESHESMHRNIIKFNNAVLKNWERHNLKSRNRSNLAWHDHSSALRARNIFWWANHLMLRAPSDKVTEWLKRLTISHCSWLSKSNNYSRHTNHGFDQAYILSLIAYGWKDDTEFWKYSDVASERLCDEILFAFTEEGVHKENSPGYQSFMLSRLKAVHELETLGFESDSLDLSSLITKAERFQERITMPNGELPMIGDTLGGIVPVKRNDVVSANKRLDADPTADVSIDDYTKSGYFIAHVAGDHGNQLVQLIMKCCHDSDYHRHDDDLSIHVATKGGVVLGDAGLYSHNETDAARIFCRSPCAHNVVFPEGFDNAERRRKELDAPPTLQMIGNTGALGETHAYSGFVVRREIDVVKKKKCEFRISDWVIPKEAEYSGGAICNFLIPGFQSLRHCANGKIVVETDSATLEIGGFLKPFDMSISRGKRSRPGGGVYSDRYQKLRACARLVLRWRASDSPFTYYLKVS